MATIPSDFLKTMGFDIETPQDRLLVHQSVIEHTRNGRGFWPVIQVNGIPQVLQFSIDQSQKSIHGHPYDHRWTPETGSIHLIPLHALRVVDWPRVRHAG